MTRVKKILLGILTIWPLVWGIIFIFQVLTTLIASFAVQDIAGALWTFGSIAVLIIIHYLTLLLVLGLLIYYVLRVLNHPQYDTLTRVVWLLLLVFAGLVAMPVYWYLHIWKARKDK